MRRILRIALAAAALALPATACTHADRLAGPGTTALAGVSPAGGAVGVDPNGMVTATFDHALMPGMERYAALHEGDVTGPVVAGTWAMSADRAALTFTPASPLKHAARYTIHLGGGIMGADDRPVNMAPGQMMGGQYVTGTMMGGGMMGGSGMMGGGWQGAGGTYGMIFSFTTA